MRIREFTPLFLHEVYRAGFNPPTQRNEFLALDLPPRLTLAKGARRKASVSVYSHNAKHGRPLAELLETTVVKNFFYS
jgi:hypothetical protein